MDASLQTLSGDEGTATGSVYLAQHFDDSYRYVICLDLDKSVVALFLNSGSKPFSSQGTCSCTRRHQWRDRGGKDLEDAREQQTLDNGNYQLGRV